MLADDRIVLCQCQRKRMGTRVLVVPMYFGDETVRNAFPILLLEYGAELRLCLFAALRPLGQVEQVDAGVVRGRHHGVQLLFVNGRVECRPRGQPDVGHPQTALAQVPVPESGRQARRLRGRSPVHRVLGRGRLQFGAQLFRGAAQVGHAVQTGYRRLASAQKINDTSINTYWAYESTAYILTRFKQYIVFEHLQVFEYLHG